MRTVLAVIAVLLIVVPPAPAMEISGIELAPTFTVDDTQLVLNGAGLREKLWVDVYVGALYLPEKMDSGEKILAADEPMVMRMHFVRAGVSPEQLQDSWRESLGQTVDPQKMKDLEDNIQAFIRAFDTETEKGTVYDIVYLPEQGLSVRVNGEQKAVVGGLEMKKAVFGVWLGDPPAKGLRKMKDPLLGEK
ncbi:MAG: chalcone isomerase family protein [Deltaproteobacteria bacterium]|nr:chalcone isomerase family protein [Deltaproteobacteria bacterium]